MDVVNEEQARIAEEAGACAVMALERVPSDIRKRGTFHSELLILCRWCCKNVRSSGANVYKRRCFYSSDG